MKYKSEGQKKAQHEWQLHHQNKILQCLSANISKVYFIPKYESLIAYVFCLWSWFFLAQSYHTEGITFKFISSKT